MPPRSFLAGAEGFRTPVCASARANSAVSACANLIKDAFGILDWVRICLCHYKNKRTSLAVLLFLAGAEGFEPTTNGFGDRDSTS